MIFVGAFGAVPVASAQAWPPAVLKLLAHAASDSADEPAVDTSAADPFQAQPSEATVRRAKDPAWKPACLEVAKIQIGDPSRPRGLRNYCLNRAGEILACFVPAKARVPGSECPDASAPGNKAAAEEPSACTPRTASYSTHGRWSFNPSVDRDLFCLDLRTLEPVWRQSDDALGDHATLLADTEGVLLVTLGGELWSGRPRQRVPTSRNQKSGATVAYRTEPVTRSVE